MTLKIYSDCISQPSRALVLFCRVSNIPHEYHQLRIGNGDLRTDEMAQINPFKTVRINIRPRFVIVQKLLLNFSPLLLNMMEFPYLNPWLFFDTSQKLST